MIAPVKTGRGETLPKIHQQAVAILHVSTHPPTASTMLLPDQWKPAQDA